MGKVNNLDLKQLDTLIRQGDARQVPALIAQIKPSDIKRKDLNVYADLARRVPTYALDGT